MLTHDEIARIADEVLRATLGPLGYERAYVTDALDVDGEPSIQVVAHFRRGVLPADGKSALDALTQLRTELHERGEERFPFLRYDYPDDEIPALSPEEFLS